MPPKADPVVDDKDGEEGEEPPAPPCGKFFYLNGATYDGEWKFEEPVEEENPDPKAPPPPAEGEEGYVPPKKLRHGKGKYIEGTYSYEGDWVEDKMEGEGKFLYESGACYEGSWVANQYHGKGKYVWANGSSYEGDWEDNKMHGEGVFQDTEEHRWAGQFHNGSGPGLTCQL